MIKDVPIVIPDDVTYTIETLENNGFEAFIVGGCVRDSILRRTPKDWDITTNALPLDVLNIFKNLRFNVIETGLKHGTVTVMINHVGYEITTYRIDGEYEDSRHPSEVKFVTDIKKDLARRDFTINAMAYNLEKGLVDPFNGLDDLKNKIIRCVGNPLDRFSEDALRMMRAIRFSAQLGFNIEKDTLCGIEELFNNLSNVSQERIREEFNKTLIHDSKKVYDYIYSHLIDTFLPELIDMRGFNQNNPYHDLYLLDHTIQTVQIVENKLHLKLTMLLHDTGKVKTKTTDENGISHYYGHPKESVTIATNVLKRMKYDNETIDKVITLIGYHDCTLENKTSVKRMLNKIGEDLLRDLIKVHWADILAQNPVYAKERLTKLVKVEQILEEIVSKQECFSVKNLAINGKDLIELGYKQGKELGVILNVLLDKVIEDSSINTKENLIEIVKGL